MRILAFALLLIPIALPAGVQRTSAHDGVYEGSRVQECRRTGQAGRTRVVGQLRGASFSIDSLPGRGECQMVYEMRRSSARLRN